MTNLAINALHFWDLYEETTMQDYIEKRGWFLDHEYRDEWRKNEPFGCFIVAPLRTAYELELYLETIQ